MPSWTDLVLAPTNARNGPPDHQTIRAISRTDRRLRQIREALSTLADLGLIDLPGPEVRRDRYAQFRLLGESARPIGDRQYRPRGPFEDEDAFSLPSDFFINGWVHALESSEIALLIMLYAHHSVVGTRAGRSSVYVAGSHRVRYYGLGADAYRSHLLLEKAGILESWGPASYRRPTGGLRGFDAENPPPPLRFQIKESGFDQPALQALLNALKNVPC
ncbi:hypothetical protein AB0M43_34880 [Longispora sp. NPDC051575]|uniref:hypothetical protein n=1 Tax=Longispora sp. NPDC051575 TaxID=3154943 RepID=UPI003437A139